MKRKQSVKIIRLPVRSEHPPTSMAPEARADDWNPIESAKLASGEFPIDFATKSADRPCDTAGAVVVQVASGQMSKDGLTDFIRQHARESATSGG